MAAKNIVKLQNNKRINLGTIIFVVLFIYVIICIVMSVRSKTIVGYQVKTGALSENRIYNGIALRNETIVNSDHTGYVSYLLREGERAAFNNLVYCIDETGKLSDLIGNDPTAENLLSDSEMNSLRQEIKLFSKNFDETLYADAKAFQTRIGNELAQIENRMIIEDVSSINSKRANDIIDYCRAYSPGIVLYYHDGYENDAAGNRFLATDLTPDDFDMSKYEKKFILNDDLIEAGSFAYKYVFDENWSIVILVPNDDVARITASDYVEVFFSKTQTSSWGRVNLINTFENSSMIELSFTNSMVSFCKDRFIEVELKLEDDKGLKIPNSAIADKNFYLIEKDYVTRGDNSSNYGVLRYEDSTDTVKFVKINVYKETDDVYYVDESALPRGSRLVKIGEPVANDRKFFIVGAEGSLTGVYSINKGFADFKRIEILYQNEEYAIIRPNAAFGLRAYDYIALDAKTVNDKDFVY
ncbi:MAG: hypothetical protein K5796_04155 [Lachnospiraceae bacterium]|nr:hypothetical protein [Lachnospiraceae bacterium]